MTGNSRVLVEIEAVPATGERCEGCIFDATTHCADSDDRMSREFGLPECTEEEVKGNAIIYIMRKVEQ